MEHYDPTKVPETNNSGKGNSSTGQSFNGKSKKYKNEDIGFIGEKFAFELLKKEFDSVEWVSEYAIKAGFPNGKDGLGYDFECKKGEETRSDEFGRYYTEFSKIKNVEIAVVNTCFEYWLLLHFKYSKKQFSDCDETQKELEKVFKGYQKTEKFYKQSNNIYNQLKDKLPEAVINASKLGNFDIKNPNNPVCEIYKLFNKDGSFNTNLK